MRHSHLTSLLLVLCALLASGCGGGGNGSPITNCGLDAFTPNYARDLSHLLVWPTFPVRVYFVRDSGYTAARQGYATAGFDQWVDATGGAVAYRIVSSAADADVTVRFDPTTANGLTTFTFSGFTLTSAAVTVGIQDAPAGDIQCVAAHEFGHALGIDGHSSRQGDLMYPVYVSGTDCPVTARDVNTLKTGYCNLFSRRPQQPTATVFGPTRIKTIE